MTLEHSMDVSIEFGDRRSLMVLEDELEEECRHLEELLRTRSDG